MADSNDSDPDDSLDDFPIDDPGSEPDEAEEDEEDVDPQSELDDDVDAAVLGTSRVHQISFFTICERLEHIWECRKKARSDVKTEDKLLHLLPPALLHELKQSRESIFPLFRLLMPDKDASRHLQIKEKMLANMYSTAFRLPNAESMKLKKFTEPMVVGTDQAGDFSQVLYSVLQDGRVPPRASSMTIGDVNQWLDELSALKTAQKSLHRQHSQADDAEPPQKRAKPEKLLDKRARKIRELNPDYGDKRGFSALEHKWMARIIQGKMECGLGFMTILQWFHPRANEYWAAHNSLERTCVKMVLENEETMDKPTIEFGTIFTPMLSARTGFKRVLNDLSARHRLAVQDQPPLRDTLAFVHPAFTMETKLDGERMLMHVRRDGVVMMHTRNGNWYSNIYTPVLGPAVRRAVGHLGMDLILDGEVLAWDDEANESVPFGNNRTVALLRRKWMEQQGICEARDKNVHEDSDRVRIMMEATAWTKDKTVVEHGDQCWLVFVAFDVLYVDGPGVDKLFHDVLSPGIVPRPNGGSIIHLDGFERKKLLYRIVKPQKNEVEIVDTVVVRPNGKTASGARYFDTQDASQEYGYASATLDSISCAMSGEVERLREIDDKRRHGLSDERISEERARAVEHVYTGIVEDQRKEGLVFKDLNAPYTIGTESKSLHHWLKFKPDYYNGAAASDLDVVFIGAYYSVGMNKTGSPASFLCACVDSRDPRVYMPFCRVNGGSMDRMDLKQFMKETGYKTPMDRDSDVFDFGRWYEAKDENGGRLPLPDFISHRTEQEGESSWKASTKVFPDLWIHPEHSVVFTLNAGEIVESVDFPPGLTLRFPRITRARFGDDKPPNEIVSDLSLRSIYQEVLDQRSAGDTMGISGVDLGSPSKSRQKVRRFLTESEYMADQKKVRSARRGTPLFVRSFPSETPGQLESMLLKGQSFVVLEGNYSFDDSHVDAALAKEEGWYDLARAVTGGKSVGAFIKKHGGTLKVATDLRSIVLGGLEDDARVVVYTRGIERADRQLGLSQVKGAKKQELFAKIQYQEGVVRWTFVYSLVARLQQGSTTPSTKPTIVDYLLRPMKEEEKTRRNGIEKALAELDVATVPQMQRVLHVVHQQSLAYAAKNKIKEAALPPWQYEAMQNLDGGDRWVMNNHNNHFWPYKDAADGEEDPMYFFPDIFIDFGYESADKSDKEILLGKDGYRWSKHKRPDDAQLLTDCIEAALPLARAMGALVTPHLHDKVTHVVCNLSNGKNEMNGLGRVAATSFGDPTMGRQLLQRLQDVGLESTVTLVSPQWIRDKWNQA